MNLVSDGEQPRRLVSNYSKKMAKLFAKAENSI